MNNQRFHVYVMGQNVRDLFCDFVVNVLLRHNSEKQNWKGFNGDYYTTEPLTDNQQLSWLDRFYYQTCFVKSP